MHTPVEARLALDENLAHQRAPMVADMHRALLTALLAHVQHTLYSTIPADLPEKQTVFTSLSRRFLMLGRGDRNKPSGTKRQAYMQKGCCYSP